jgi:hypothetical protein
MGWMDDARAQWDRGKSAGEHAASGKRLSTDGVMKARLSAYWLALVVAIIVGGAAFSFGHIGRLRAVALGLLAGLVTAIVVVRLLHALARRLQAR